MKSLTYCPYCKNPLIEKFVEERQRLFCTACHTPIYENPVPATAGVVLDEQERILLVKRGVEPKRGQWCLPGGFIEIEETPEACCLRELKEETDLDGEIGRLVGVYLGESSLYKSVLIIGYSIENIRGEPRAGDDSLDAVFFAIPRMPPLAFRSHESLVQDALKLLGRNRWR